MKKLSFFALITVLYFYIFNPMFTFVGFGAIKLLYPIMLIVPFKLKEVNRIEIRRLFLPLLLLMILDIVIELKGSELPAFYSSILVLIEDFFLPLSILLLFNSFLEKYYNVILAVTIVACSITIASIFSPDFRSYILNIQIIDSDDLEGAFLFRGFGLGESLTSTYGNCLAILGICIFYYFGKFKKTYLLFPVIFVCIILNARTPVIIFTLSIILYIIYQYKIQSLYVISAMAVPLICTFLIAAAVLGDETLTWLEQFYLELNDSFTGSSDAQKSTISVIAGEMIFLPDNLIEIIIGTGKDVFKSGANTSDVGWIRTIFAGGILSVCLQLQFVYYVMKMLKIRYLVISFLIVIAIANTKGLFLINSGGMRLIILISMAEFFNYFYKTRKIKCKI